MPTNDKTSEIAAPGHHFPAEPGYIEDSIGLCEARLAGLKNVKRQTKLITAWLILTKKVHRQQWERHGNGNGNGNENPSTGTGMQHVPQKLCSNRLTIMFKLEQLYTQNIQPQLRSRNGGG